MLTLEFDFYLQVFVAGIHSVSYYVGPIFFGLKPGPQL